MEMVEALVTVTATDSERSTKRMQQRLITDLLDDILDVLEPMQAQLQKLAPEKQNQKPAQQQQEFHDYGNNKNMEGNESFDTSSYPTVFGEEEGTGAASDFLPVPGSHSNNAGGPPPAVRSLEADLVALDRQASVSRIYGDLEIDDIGDEAHGPEQRPRDARSHFANVAGRAKSLRDLCEIETIEEEDEMSDSTSRLSVSERSDVDISRSSRKSNASTASDISDRSASVRNIYGDVLEIEERRDPLSMRKKDKASAQAIALRRFSDHDDGSLCSFEEEPLPPLRKASATSPKRDVPQSPAKKDVPPSPAKKSPAKKEDSNRSLHPEEPKEVQSPVSPFDRSVSSRDRAPSLVGRAVSTREIFGEIEIDEGGESDEAKNDDVYGDADIDDSKNNHSYRDGEETDDKSEANSVDFHGDADIEGGKVNNSNRNWEETDDKSEAKSEDLYGDADIDDGNDNNSKQSLQTHSDADAIDDSSVSVVSIDEVEPDIEDTIDDIYDTLSLDGVEETRAIARTTGRATGGEDGWDSDSVGSVSIDNDYDSDSSQEDEQYFHDHARQHLAVLASAMTRVRAATKGTRRYARYQNSILESKRAGPLAVVVKSVAEFDSSETNERKMTMSDESSGDDSSTGSGEQTSNYSGVISSSGDEESLREHPERAKQRSFIIAKAVARWRATNRAAVQYRKFLNAYFSPRSRRGPLTLVEDSESSPVRYGGRNENAASESSESGVYLEEASAGEEPLADSQPSLLGIDDSGGDVGTDDDAEDGPVRPSSTRSGRSPANDARERSAELLDESEGSSIYDDIAEIAGVVGKAAVGSERRSEGIPESKTEDPGDREMQEWEAVAAATQGPASAAATASDNRNIAKMNLDAGESKSNDDPRSGPQGDLIGAVERELIVDHIHDIKAQMRKWEDIFVASSESMKTSSETLLISNESLRSSVFESIEDSHHFAAYLDKMLSQRIEQLEQAIRSQSALVSHNVAMGDHPLEGTLTVLPKTEGSASRLLNPFEDPALIGEMKGDEEEKDAEESRQEMIHDMVVNVTEWKRLQDKLRGTEEVAEAYRKQVLQLRNVLEVKINEGNASLHQVEVLQRKLQEAHDREVQAQKQLRPVTRRVEQVIQEMVELEERSARLQIENGQLREQLWMSQREC